LARKFPFAKISGAPALLERRSACAPRRDGHAEARPSSVYGADRR